MANNDGSLIDQFFDLQALINQQNEILKKNAEFAKTMKSSFSDTLKGQDVSGLQSISKEIDKVVTTTTKAKAAVTDYEKAQANLAKQIAQNNVAKQELNKILDNELYSTNELIAQNKLLEAVRRNLNSSDKDYAANQQRIIAAQDKNNAKIKEYQTLDNQRLSGIGKYKQAIEEAMAGDGSYRTQLQKLRNTMAELEGEIEKATAKYGANSQQVKDLTAEYTRMEQRAGKLTDAQGDMQQRIKYLADDYGKFKAVLAGVQAAMGIVSVFSGFTNLLGIHSERVEKVTAKMASMLAVMQGLKQVQELLNKDNYFVQFIKNTPALNSALTKIKGAFLAVKASMGWISIVVGAAIGTFLLLKKVIDDSKTPIDEFNKSLNDATTESERLTVANTYLNEKLGDINASFVDVHNVVLKLGESYDDLINKMVQLSLLEVQKGKMKEILDATFQYAVKKQLALKEIEEIENKSNAAMAKIAKERKEEIEKEGAYNLRNVRSTDFPEVQEIQTKRDTEIQNINKSLDILYKDLEQKQKDFADLMGINAEEVSKIMKDLTKAFSEYMIEQAKNTENAGKNVKKSLKETGEEVDKFTIKAAKFKKVDFFDRGMINNISEFDSKLTDFVKIINELEQERLNKLNDDIEELRKKLYAGTISIEEYNVALKEMTNQSVLDGLKNQIAFLEAISTALPKGEELDKIKQKIKELKKEINDIEFESISENIEKIDIENKVETIVSAIQTVFSSLTNFINDSFSIGLTREEELLQLADSRYMNSYEARKKYIEENIADETERANLLNNLESERIKHQEQVQKKEAELKARQTRFNNAMKIVETQVQLAAAIALMVTEASSGDPYSLPGRIAAAVAAGIAAMGAVYSALSQINTIPSYEKGGDVKKDIIFRAGEKGTELGFGQQTGKVYNFNKDGLYKVKENVKIMDANKSRQIMQQQTINNNKEVNLRNVVYVKVIDNQRVKRYFKNI